MTNPVVQLQHLVKVAEWLEEEQFYELTALMVGNFKRDPLEWKYLQEEVAQLVGRLWILEGVKGKPVWRKSKRTKKLSSSGRA